MVHTRYCLLLPSFATREVEDSMHPAVDVPGVAALVCLNHLPHPTSLHHTSPNSSWVLSPNLTPPHYKSIAPPHNTLAPPGSCCPSLRSCSLQAQAPIVRFSAHSYRPTHTHSALTCTHTYTRCFTPPHTTPLALLTALTHLMCRPDDWRRLTQPFQHHLLIIAA